MNIPDEKVRISKIAGNYLVFDINHVDYLRRNQGVCGTFIGQIPQAPTQNIFSGLPLQLPAGQVKFLVDRGVAYVQDAPVAHLAALNSLDPSKRKAYVESVRQQRRVLQAANESHLAEVRRHSQLARAEARAKKAGGKSGKRPGQAKREESTADTDAKGEKQPAAAEPEEETLFEAPQDKASTPRDAYNLAITPTTSEGLVQSDEYPAAVEQPGPPALQAYLNTRGYYMTPGLRFGGDFSVYPGDPFRYHGHFVARTYAWDEGINMLDLVTAGRLCSNVKKGFVFGAEKPGDGAGDIEGSNVRAFSLEWAAL